MPSPDTHDRPENRLAAETSPYLRQHRHDPVDWYPWGPEALQTARDLDRPLFLSIGYSACHWCHVMAHESFADEITAAEMNDLVVAVKVDREERPDVDAIYMEAVQAATGHGGWPMSIFATPDGRPFYAGTYFPNRPGRGAPTFRAVLAAVSKAWTAERDAVIEQADDLSEAVARRLAPPAAVQAAGPAAQAAVTEAIATACARLTEMADPERGGFGRAPKFPQPLFLELLLTAHVEGIGADADPPPLKVALTALEAMASGGIWDHLGGGFSRYSVDREWLAPHFEKMLYDQALLARVYLHAWQITGDQRWRQVLDEIVAYVLRDLSLPEGGLASAEDADSEGEEGRFYLWDTDQLSEVLGQSSPALAWWGVRPGGNFEGRSILYRAKRGDLIRPPEIEAARQALFVARSLRVRPGRDDKVLTEWNAMMCATLAEAALATGEASWQTAAKQLGALLITRSRRASDGRVLRCPPRGDAQPDLLGYAADAAWVVEACVRLAECTGDASWLSHASEVADQLLELFEDPEAGGLFATGADAEKLLVRPREVYDNVTPSAVSVAVGALARLGSLLCRDDYDEAARRLLSSAAGLLTKAPTVVPALAGAADLLATGIVEVAVSGDRGDLVRGVGRQFLPRVVLAWTRRPEPTSRTPERFTALTSPLLEGREDGFAYVCRARACRLPAASVEQLDVELEAAMLR